MRQALRILVVAALLAAVVAAGLKTVAGRNHAASTKGISVAVPPGIRDFSSDLLPQ